MKNTKVSLFLMISQIIYVLFSAVWIVAALTSFMMFDTPEALEDTLTVVVFILIWLYPLALIGAVIASWILYHKQKFRGAVWIGLIPLVWVLPFLSIFI